MYCGVTRSSGEFINDFNGLGDLVCGWDNLWDNFWLMASSFGFIDLGIAMQPHTALR